MTRRRKWDADPLSQAMQRMEQAVDALDDRAARVLAFHAVLEQQIGTLLAMLLPSADKLVKLGFGQLVSVLDAAWPTNIASIDRTVLALIAFNNLRNAVAHNDRREIDAAQTRLGLIVFEGDDIAAQDIDAIAASLMLWLGIASHNCAAGISTPPNDPEPQA